MNGITLGIEAGCFERMSAEISILCVMFDDAQRFELDLTVDECAMHWMGLPKQWNETPNIVGAWNATKICLGDPSKTICVCVVRSLTEVPK